MVKPVFLCAVLACGIAQADDALNLDNLLRATPATTTVAPAAVNNNPLDLSPLSNLLGGASANPLNDLLKNGANLSDLTNALSAFNNLSSGLGSLTQGLSKLTGAAATNSDSATTSGSVPTDGSGKATMSQGTDTATPVATSNPLDLSNLLNGLSPLSNGLSDLSSLTNGLSDLSSLTSGLTDLSSLTSGLSDLSSLTSGLTDVSSLTNTLNSLNQLSNLANTLTGAGSSGTSLSDLTNALNTLNTLSNALGTASGSNSVSDLLNNNDLTSALSQLLSNSGTPSLTDTLTNSLSSLSDLSNVVNDFQSLGSTPLLNPGSANPLASSLSSLTQDGNNAVISGLVNAFVTNGYLNAAGQSAVKLSGMATEAYNYPDLASCLNGMTPCLDTTTGELTHSVQTALAQMGISARVPTDLVTYAMNRGFGRRLSEAKSVKQALADFDAALKSAFEAQKDGRRRLDVWDRYDRDGYGYRLGGPMDRMPVMSGGYDRPMMGDGFDRPMMGGGYGHKGPMPPMPHRGGDMYDRHRMGGHRPGERHFHHEIEAFGVRVNPVYSEDLNLQMKGPMGSFALGGNDFPPPPSPDMMRPDMKIPPPHRDMRGSAVPQPREGEQNFPMAGPSPPQVSQQDNSNPPMYSPQSGGSKGMTGLESDTEVPMAGSKQPQSRGSPNTLPTMNQGVGGTLGGPAGPVGMGGMGSPLGAPSMMPSGDKPLNPAMDGRGGKYPMAADSAFVMGSPQNKMAVVVGPSREGQTPTVMHLTGEKLPMYADQPEVMGSSVSGREGHMHLRHHYNDVDESEAVASNSQFPELAKLAANAAKDNKETQMFGGFSSDSDSFDDSRLDRNSERWENRQYGVSGYGRNHHGYSNYGNMMGGGPMMGSMGPMDFDYGRRHLSAKEIQLSDSAKKVLAAMAKLQEEQREGAKRRRLSNWLESSYNKLVGTIAENHPSWKEDMQSAANSLAEALSGVVDELKNGELPDRLETFWQEYKNNVTNFVRPDRKHEGDDGSDADIEATSDTDRSDADDDRHSDTPAKKLRRRLQELSEAISSYWPQASDYQAANYQAGDYQGTPPSPFDNSQQATYQEPNYDLQQVGSPLISSLASPLMGGINTLTSPLLNGFGNLGAPQGANGLNLGNGGLGNIANSLSSGFGLMGPQAGALNVAGITGALQGLGFRRLEATEGNEETVHNAVPIPEDLSSDLGTLSGIEPISHALTNDDLAALGGLSNSAANSGVPDLSNLASQLSNLDLPSLAQQLSGLASNSDLSNLASQLSNMDLSSLSQQLSGLASNTNLTDLASNLGNLNPSSLAQSLPNLASNSQLSNLASQLSGMDVNSLAQQLAGLGNTANLTNLAQQLGNASNLSQQLSSLGANATNLSNLANSLDPSKLGEQLQGFDMGSLSDLANNFDMNSLSDLANKFDMNSLSDLANKFDMNSLSDLANNFDISKLADGLDLGNLGNMLDGMDLGNLAQQLAQSFDFNSLAQQVVPSTNKPATVAGNSDTDKDELQGVETDKVTANGTPQNLGINNLAQQLESLTSSLGNLGSLSSLGNLNSLNSALSSLTNSVATQSSESALSGLSVSSTTTSSPPSSASTSLASLLNGLSNLPTLPNLQEGLGGLNSLGSLTGQAANNAGLDSINNYLNALGLGTPTTAGTATNVAPSAAPSAAAGDLNSLLSGLGLANSESKGDADLQSVGEVSTINSEAGEDKKDLTEVDVNAIATALGGSNLNLTKLASELANSPFDLNEIARTVSSSQIDFNKLMDDLVATNVDLNAVMETLESVDLNNVLKTLGASRVNLTELASAFLTQGAEMDVSQLLTNPDITSLLADPEISSLIAGFMTLPTYSPGKSVQSADSAAADLLNSLGAQLPGLNSLTNTTALNQQAAQLTEVLSALLKQQIGSVSEASVQRRMLQAANVDASSMQSAMAMRNFYGQQVLTSGGEDTAFATSSDETSSTPKSVDVDVDVEVEFVQNTDNDMYTATSEDLGLEWDFTVRTAMVPPLMACWEVDDVSESEDDWPSFVVQTAQLELMSKKDQKVLNAIDLVYTDAENLFRYYTANWNKSQVVQRRHNYGCTWVPMCVLQEAINRVTSTEDAVGARVVINAQKVPRSKNLTLPKAHIVVRGVASQGQWTPVTSQDEATTDDLLLKPVAYIKANFTGSPLFAFELPKPQTHTAANPGAFGDAEASISGYAVIASAESTGLVWDFTEDDWNWIPQRARIAYSRILDQVKHFDSNYSGPGDVPADEDSEDQDYEATAIALFNAKRDLPLKVPQFTFMPRIVLEASSSYAPGQEGSVIQRCLPMAAAQASSNIMGSDPLSAAVLDLLYASAGAKLTAIRMKSYLEAAPLQAVVSSQDGQHTFDMSEGLIKDYREAHWTINVSLSPLQPSFLSGASAGSSCTGSECNLYSDGFF